MINSRSQIFNAVIPRLTVTILVINLLKEVLQMITEGTDYLSFDNFADLTAFVLVSIC